MKNKLVVILLITMHLTACGQDEKTDNDISPNLDVLASIVSVSTTGNENSYSFSVGISSQETGCAQYADWWEVISEDGVLLYRRILAHSHVNEQPFIRSGGPINISATQTIIFRAHMNTSGYGTMAFKGSVSQGFVKTTIAKDFANELANQNPQPGTCAF